MERIGQIHNYNISGAGGAVSTGRVPATNLFQEGTLFDLYVYVSEQKEFGEFHVRGGIPRFWILNIFMHWCGREVRPLIFYFLWLVSIFCRYLGRYLGNQVVYRK